MVDFLNEDITFAGTTTHEGELIADGGLAIGPGGISFGESSETPAENWPGQVRVQVADVTERAAVVAWRAANDPITADRPLLVWRRNGSLTGVNEITLNGTDWYAESPLAGDVEMTMAAAAPFGWLLLQGQLLANAATNYPALWAVASPVYRVGSDLRLPDLRGRVPMGAGTGTGLTLRNLGDAVGAESVALSEGQLAEHDHPINHNHPSVNTGGRSHAHTHAMTLIGTEDESHDHGGDTYQGYPSNAPDPDNNTYAGSGTYSTGSESSDHYHAVDLPNFVGDSGSAGAGEPHANVQPSVVINFKVKV